MSTTLYYLAFQSFDLNTFDLNPKWGRGSVNINEKFPTDGKVLAHFGVNSTILSGSLTDLSALVGFCTSSPQQGVKYQL
jgi:hypothetical protein